MPNTSNISNLKLRALLHFRTPPIVIDDSSWKNTAESFAVALTLTLGGYESAIAPIKVTPSDQSYPIWFRISSKKLIITYRKGIELKANYHVVLHSVAGACVM